MPRPSRDRPSARSTSLKADETMAVCRLTIQTVRSLFGIKSGCQAQMLNRDQGIR